METTQRKRLSKSYNGLMKFLKNRELSQTDSHKLINNFCEKNNIGGTLDERCEKIQKDFTSFAKYCNSKTKPKKV